MGYSSQMVTEQSERENKYEAEPGFVLPDLAQFVPAGGRSERATVGLDSVYFDTGDLDLLRYGVTLRCRTGTTDTGWQLKVPDGDARTEIRLDDTGSQTTVPKELSALVAGVRRGKTLRHIVTIRTDRAATRIIDGAETVIVEVADDRVDAVAPGRRTATISTWREIEAELGPGGSEEILDAIDGTLRRSGARTSPSANKVARALNAAEPVAPALGDRTAGAVILAYLAAQDRQLVEGDLSLRRVRGGIHPTRVATRRLRSTLRIFADYFDADRAQALDEELSWYAGVLGEVRDREVQRARFAAAVAELPPEEVLGPVAARIDQVLLTEQIKYQKALLRAMNTKRYFALLREVQIWVTEPPFTALAQEKPARLRAAVAKAGKKVSKHLAGGLGPDGDDEELHKARKAGKRARYAAELAAAVLGKGAKKSADRFEELQDILGEHQDSVVAAELLRRLGSATASQDSDNGFTYGLLYAREQRSAAESRLQAASWKAP